MTMTIKEFIFITFFVLSFVLTIMLGFRILERYNQDCYDNQGQIVNDTCVYIPR